MGGFLGFGNSSGKTDRANQLSGINASWNVYNRGLPASDTQIKSGTTAENSGFQGLEAVKKYWGTLMGGNRPAVMQAAAPAVNAVNEQADAQRRQEAEMGTSRGGGTNAANQEAEAARTGAVSDIISKVQPAAATGLETVAKDEGALGGQQMREALSSLGLSKEVADEIVNSSIASRPISLKANAEVRQQWSDFIAALGL